MTKIIVLLAICGMALSACVEAGSGAGRGRGAADPADQSPNH